jgi:hypothetical protein
MPELARAYGGKAILFEYELRPGEESGVSRPIIRGKWGFLPSDDVEVIMEALKLYHCPQNRDSINVWFTPLFEGSS